MSTWLANAELPRNLTSNLWKAKLDEANIPVTKTALLAFVVRNRSHVELKRAQVLQECLGKSNSENECEEHKLVQSEHYLQT